MSREKGESLLANGLVMVIAKYVSQQTCLLG